MEDQAKLKAEVLELLNQAILKLKDCPEPEMEYGEDETYGMACIALGQEGMELGSMRLILEALVGGSSETVLEHYYSSHERCHG